MDVVFFPSISSVAKNRWSPLQHLETLVALNHERFLFSAFDYFYSSEPELFEKQLKKAKAQGQYLLMDSGIYEVSWKSDTSWSLPSYIKVINELEVDSAFMFDHDSNGRLLESADEIINQYRYIESKVTAQSNIIPIVHGSPSSIVSNAKVIIQELRPKVIAVAEREIGKGISEGLSNLRELEEWISTNAHNTVIHVLGVGNPLTIMLYSSIGVNSFDGLDWCQTVVDFDTGKLFHSLQLDFFKHQSSLGNIKELDYLARCFGHNLEYYSKLIFEINDNYNLTEMLKQFIPREFLEEHKWLLDMKK